MQLIIFLTTLTILTGCYSPYANEVMIIEPTADDVVGIYEFDFQTVDHSLDNNELRKGRLLINEDGTFNIVDLPSFEATRPMTYRFGKQVSLSGTWKIETIGAVDFGYGSLKENWGLILDSAPDELRYAEFIGTEKPKGLLFTFGDPDAGEVIMLKKN